jgi:FlaA1/EpsC-like NDP-sugar epimerase
MSLIKVFLEYRRGFIVAAHVLLILLSNYLAFWLRFDGNVTPTETKLMIDTGLWLILIRTVIFVPLRLYEGLWRYSGIWDLRNIVVGVLASTTLFYLLVHWGLGVNAYPRSVFIIDSLVLIFFMGGVRISYRLYQQFPSLQSRKHVLIYGAGDAGEMIVRDMKHHVTLYNYKPVGFLDDDEKKIGRHIHGVPVLGGRDRLDDIIGKTRPDEVIIAIPSAKRAMIRDLVKAVEKFNVVIKTLPNLREIRDGHIGLNQTRNISSEDLLDRVPVGLEIEPIHRLVQGKSILVTGAAGSIGSELCRQIATYNPANLVLLDKSEGGLFAIDTELSQKFPRLQRSAVLVDIKHVNPLREVFRQYAPEIVLHAAAYKHVPMMEFHPEEAVLNNIVGTSRLSHVAIEHKVEKFMLISTDKAVNPTNVMGATKRVAEIYVDALECNVHNEETIFAAVRFGNVLGSSGSVLPLFRKQIETGGPVTITHRDVTRYFMTIPEAVQLVLRAMTLAEGGEIFVLDMGQPVKLLDMARNLIRSAGLVPEKDIAIKFIGLRPGEKLHEELVGPDETVQRTPASKILKIVPCSHVNPVALMERILEMEKLAIAGASKALLEILCEIVPNFHPVGLNATANPSEADFKLDAVSNLSSPVVSLATKRSKSRL